MVLDAWCLLSVCAVCWWCAGVSLLSLLVSFFTPFFPKYNNLNPLIIRNDGFLRTFLSSSWLATTTTRHHHSCDYILEKKNGIELFRIIVKCVVDSDVFRPLCWLMPVKPNDPSQLRVSIDRSLGSTRPRARCLEDRWWSISWHTTSNFRNFQGHSFID